MKCKLKSNLRLTCVDLSKSLFIVKLPIYSTRAHLFLSYHLTYYGIFVCPRNLDPFYLVRYYIEGQDFLDIQKLINTISLTVAVGNPPLMSSMSFQSSVSSLLVLT